MLDPLPRRAKSIVESAARIQHHIAKYDAPTPNNKRGDAAMAKSEARELLRKLEELVRILDGDLASNS